jgi:predicted dehydrogenase
MSRKTKYTAALVGTGRIGFSLGLDRKREQPASHTMALLKNRRIRLIAACDTDATRLDDWHRFYPKAAVYSTCAYMFAACTPDIVVIAVNENAHYETMLAALRSRPKLIILEKPVALTVKQGIEIADAAEKAGVPVLINHERRFAADYDAAVSYIGKIGQIQSMTAELDSGLRVYSAKDEATGEYSLLHDGTHLVDIVQYLAEKAGKPGDERRSVIYDPVLTDMHTDPEDRSVVRNISVHCSSDICSDIQIKISGRSRFFAFGIDVLGTEGRIRIGNGYAEFYRREQSKLYTGFYSLERDRSVKLPKKTGYFSNMVKNAVDFLDGRAPLRSTIRDGLRDMDILEQIKAEITDEL